MDFDRRDDLAAIGVWAQPSILGGRADWIWSGGMDSGPVDVSWHRSAYISCIKRQRTTTLGAFGLVHTLFLIVPLLLERVEERMHFLTFGLFGALSMALFAPRYAFIICLLGAGGDELLQFYLPDRVGDWRDVAFNALASFGAAIFFHTTVLFRRNR